MARVTGAAAIRGLKIFHGQLQNQIVLLAAYQEGTKQHRRCNHATWSLVDLLALYHGCSQKDRTHLANLFWDILVTSSNRHIEISIIRKSDSRNSGFKNFATTHLTVFPDNKTELILICTPKLHSGLFSGGVLF